MENLGQKQTLPCITCCMLYETDKSSPRSASTTVSKSAIKSVSKSVTNDSK